MKRSNSKLSRQAPSSDNLQKTLFQCWKPPNLNKSNSKENLIADTGRTPVPPDEAIAEDDDLELIHSTDTFLTNYSHNQTTNEVQNISNVNTTSIEDDSTVEKITLGIDENVLQSTQFTDTTGFDFNSGSVWIYPIKENHQIRSYQFNIVEQCLYKNTMVVLPTGMGKTFIAAVVMYNFYRWYPLGKTIFMAPTKPLVNQQSDACYQIVGIPKEDMTSMTGQMAPEKRKLLWDTKRVFFLTPQVISNDILRGTVDVNLIKCVVIDEAHKALGDYAFCKVIESISELNKNFRIIALTATPGSDIKAVQNVIDRLLISHIELRSDDSIDIQQYSNNRTVDKFVLPLNDEILKIRNAYYNVIRGPLKRLEINRVLSVRDPGSLHKFAILTRRDVFRKNVAPSMDSRRAGLIESDLAILVTLVHALELLIQYGVKSFYMFLKSNVENSDGSKSAAQQHKIRTEIGQVSEMADFYEKFKEIFDQKSKPIPRNMRHPKLLKLEEVILEHFKKFGKNDTRVMIFSQYRESVYEITEMLSEHEDIKPMQFVGQASGGSRKSVTQKEQLEVVKKFRDGGYNTLVSTCVGEEGLDIGEVDLIINYDSQKSPIRLIQRMGRTGRKREGRIVVLLTEGKEEQSYITSLSKKKDMYKFILNGKKHFKFYQNNPLMIPKGQRPRCHKMNIVLPCEQEQEEEKENKKSKKKSKLDETEQPKKKTRRSKRNSIKQEEDNSFSSQKFPDLDLDLNTNNQSLNKTPRSSNQLQLFNESNILSIKNTKLDSDILDKQKLVPDPPNFKKLFKCLNKKGKENEDLFTESFNLAECIDLWQTDEDDFMLAKETSLNITDNLDNSSLIEKFENFYINLMDGISDSEECTEPENDNQCESNEMIVEDTILIAEEKNVKETTLNDLFMDEEDDDDLKYMNDVNLMSKFCINETINNEDIKPVNKIVTQIKQDEHKIASPTSPVPVQNSSTPRSILKKKNQISYSPVDYSPKIDTDFNCTNKSVSMIGMTQALNLLDDTQINKEDKCDLFDMKSTLSYLFEDSTPNTSIKNNSTHSINFNSSGKKRIRFDEASILETSGHKKSINSNSDESLIIKKKNFKVVKDLSGSFSDHGLAKIENYSDDSEFDEIIGNNKDTSQSQVQIIDEDSETDDDFDTNISDTNQRQKKIKNKFIADEAVISGDDSEDDEDEDDYDLKDSFVDSKEHSCDESMYLRYQKSLRDAEMNRPSYLTRKLPPITDDIFSQMPTQDSWYDYDSFCVPDDQVSFNDKKSRKKKLRKKSSDSKQERFRRIKNLDMTCINENFGPNKSIKLSDEKNLHVTQLPRKKKLVNDDSDDEIIAQEILIKPVPRSSNKSLMIIDEEEEDFKSFKLKNKQSNIKPDIDCIMIDDDAKPTIKSDSNRPIETIQLNDQDEDEEFNNWINDTFSKESFNNNETSSITGLSANFINSKKDENKSFLSHFNQTHKNPPFKEQEINAKKIEQNIFTIPADLPKNNNWILIDASLLTSAADIVKNVRKIWQPEKVIIQPAINCDFIISQRNAVIRFKWSELSAASMRDQIIERYAKCKALYSTVIVIVIDDRENNKNRSKLFDSVIANLAKCSQILYSKSKTEEFSYQLYYLSNNERELGFHLDLECNKIMEKKKKDLSFYLSLPNLSFINSLYLCKNFDSISKFCISSLEELKSKGKMNDRKARKLLRFLIDS